MRVVSLLVVLVCSFTASAVPELSVATEPTSLVAATAPDAADYEVLQQQADLARDMLMQAQGRRMAMAQLAAD